MAALAATSVGIAAGMLRGADDLSKASRHRMEAAKLYREAHARVQAALRNASVASFGSLDVLGPAAMLEEDPTTHFQEVEGATEGVPILGQPLEIAYVRTTADFGGLGPVGRLVLRPSGATGGETLASQVLEGSWRLLLSGHVCTLRLGVAVPWQGAQPLVLTGETVAYLGNP